VKQVLLITILLQQKYLHELPNEEKWLECVVLLKSFSKISPSWGKNDYFQPDTCVQCVLCWISPSGHQCMRHANPSYASGVFNSNRHTFSFWRRSQTSGFFKQFALSLHSSSKLAHSIL